MDDSLTKQRHSLAHLLAAAVKELYPEALPSIGPAIDNGFYYDFDNLKEPDLAKLETTMRKLLINWTAFSGQEVDAAEAKKLFANNPYKLELIDEIETKGEKITLYTSGEFTDLCRGGHSDNLSNIDPESFRLERLAGAYWRGDEKNKMLTRIYGLAFNSQQELTDYLTMREEAEKRDHRKLGKEMDLFTFSDLVGGGLPLWTPTGTLLRDLLDGFVWSLRSMRDYERVDIPHLAKKELYETSGHWDKFKDELFKINTREGHLFVLKPMNCPHHTQIYDRKGWSYRELPQRYATTTKVYRDEQSGELSGLTRVRAITQDDAHVFCRQTQVKEEMTKIWDIIMEFYGVFGFKLSPRLSLHDPTNMESYLGSADTWRQSEQELRELVTEKGFTAPEAVGEAAFYGPKIDFMSSDSLGRTWQVATIQLDMNMPERFDLTCTNEEGKKERIVMIHAAIMGSIERFLAVLIEHLGGQFPLWLSPKQIAVLPVANNHQSYADEVATKLKLENVRVEMLPADDTLGKRIREVKTKKYPYFIVIGDKEKDSATFTLESRSGDKAVLSLPDLLTKLTTEIKNRV
ncbi:MAG: threonine--tRNA ligase [Candidatus Vogelbacteria bacterium]|nr:threonine--tRNA ligase [Candidatus Vogelbacteria bacterium]